MSRESASRAAGAALALMLAACSASSGAPAEKLAAAPAAPVQLAAASSATPPTASASIARALPDFAALVEQFGPAVVNVQVVERRETARNENGQGQGQGQGQGRRGQQQTPPGMSPDDPFYEFFRRFGMPNQGGQGGGLTPRNQPPARGLGSGFIVSPDGYILTNAHVVRGASDVTVKLVDRREYTAKVIGFDTRTDVAVIKIDAKNLPTVKIGDAAKLKPGQWVVAIGSPFTFENSVTAGIVSATARSLGPEENYVSFIQTDVAVNPGNSGGPLFNLNGEVVGINSQIYSASGGYMGLSFAIPIDIANNVREQIIKTGRVQRGRIGVQIQEINQRLADSFGLDRPRGALVAAVENDGPGDKAGMKAGDVITKVNGKLIELYGEVPAVVGIIRPGTEADVEVWRNGSLKSLSVKVAELKEDGDGSALSSRNDAEPGSTGKLGLAVRPLSSEEKRQSETDGTLLVEDVDGPAESAGVRPGDIILAVNGTPVKSIAELQAAAKKAGKNVALLVSREGQQTFLPLRVE